MADTPDTPDTPETQDLTYPDFARLHVNRYEELFPGAPETDDAWDIIQRTQVILARLPDEAKFDAELIYPDEDGTGWLVRWRQLETDEEYTARWKISESYRKSEARAKAERKRRQRNAETEVDRLASAFASDADPEKRAELLPQLAAACQTWRMYGPG